MITLWYLGVDTDISPYDSGSYASATTYVTGMAVADAAEQLRVKIKELGASMLETEPDQVEFDGKTCVSIKWRGERFLWRQ